MADHQSSKTGSNARYEVHPSDKEGYVKVEAEIPAQAIRGSEDGARARAQAQKKDTQPMAKDSAPPPGQTTATVAGYGVDDILKAPVQPPSPKPGDTGPAVAEKMNQAGYEASKKVGPQHPVLLNYLLVGFGLFVVLLGLLGLAFLGFGAALTILAFGFVATVCGIFLRF